MTASLSGLALFVTLSPTLMPNQTGFSVCLPDGENGMLAIVVMAIAAAPRCVQQCCNKHGRPDFAVFINQSVLARLQFTLRHWSYPFDNA